MQARQLIEGYWTTNAINSTYNCRKYCARTRVVGSFVDEHAKKAGAKTSLSNPEGMLLFFCHLLKIAPITYGNLHGVVSGGQCCYGQVKLNTSFFRL
jgi:hypothetical protein